MELALSVALFSAKSNLDMYVFGLTECEKDAG